MVQNGSPANHTKQSITNHRDPAEDATWILTSSFIIFTMQSGFGLLETGKMLIVFILCTMSPKWSWHFSYHFY